MGTTMTPFLIVRPSCPLAWGSPGLAPDHNTQPAYTSPAPLTKSVVGFVPPSFPLKQGATLPAPKGPQTTKVPRSRVPPSAV